MDEHKTAIRLLNAGLSEVDGEIIAQGFLDTDSMRRLKTDDYQREFLGAHKGKSHIDRALADGIRLPSIVIGMRGQRYNARSGTMFLEDPCFIVDGLQRVFTILKHVERQPEAEMSTLIGAEVRFNTTKDSERALFSALNSYRTAMSGNVLLRNLRDENKGVLTLYGLSMSDSSSPIYKKVQWNQRMQRGELITANILCHVTLALHITHNAGIGGGNVSYMDAALRNLAENIGVNEMRNNVRTFFEMMDECFHFTHIEFVQQAPSIKGNFLRTMAMVLARHQNFWNGKKLVISADNKRKFASFPLDDPEVMRLASAGSMAMPILYNLLTDHMNKGKRINRLHERVPDEKPIHKKHAQRLKIAAE